MCEFLVIKQFTSAWEPLIFFIGRNDMLVMGEVLFREKMVYVCIRSFHFYTYLGLFKHMYIPLVW